MDTLGTNKSDTWTSKRGSMGGKRFRASESLVPDKLF